MSITIRVISDLHIDINSRDGVLPHFGFEDNINDTDLVLIAGDISGHYKTTALFLEKLADKLKGLLNYPNTCFILEGHLFNNMPVDIEKIYNVYTAEVTQMGV